MSYYQFEDGSATSKTGINDGTLISSPLSVTGTYIFSVLKSNGNGNSISSDYVNLNGKVGGGSGVSKNGESKYTKNILSPGDNYNGGIVGYILQGGDPGYDPNVQHGLIVAPFDQSSNTNLGTYGSGIQYITPVDIGSG